ncbi:MAG TPA: tetratricopeptide repeat protein [Planctomycetota bacterium]|nr:tetratricopeptide repeat protein [Planctomycetota bacterium]
MPTDAEVESLFKRADESFRKHQYDYARDLFRQIITFKPDHEKAHEGLKVTLIRKFQEGGATSKFKLIAMKGQFEVQVKATKDPAKRIEACLNYLNDDPTNGKVRAILSEALLVLAHANAAAVEAKMALQDDPGNIIALKTMVQAFSQTGRIKEAQSALDRVAGLVKDDRDLEKLRRDLAAMTTMSQGFDAASQDGFRSALKNADQADDLAKRSKLVQTDADFTKLVEEIQAQGAEAPTDAKYPRQIGDLYFDKKKDYTAAREWYKKAAQLAPQDSVLRDKVDDCDLKMWELKRVAAQKANDPKLNEIRLAELKARIASFERRVMDRPTDMGLRYDLGMAYLAGSMNDKAIAEFQQSVKDPKRKSLSHFNLGKAFQRKKMFDMADKQFVSAEHDVVSQDYRLDIMYHRAKLAAEAGRIPLAIELGNKIVEIDINYKDIAQLVEKWGSPAA